MSKNSTIFKSFNNKRRVTIPCSPKLLTKYRARPSIYKSHEEQELEEFEKQPKFHALPLNTKIFHKTTGIPECEKKLLTMPQSPNLTRKLLKYSTQSTKETFYEKPNKNNYTINSIPQHDKKIFKKKTSHNHNLSLQSIPFKPFHLPGDDISRKKILKFKEKIQKEKKESERLRQFIAHPNPNKNRKPKKTKSISQNKVQIVPFTLITEKRGIVAKSPINILKIPFTITKSNKPLTEFKEIKFGTSIRAEEWIKYINQLKEKAKEIENIKQQQEEYKKLCEEELIKKQFNKTIIHTKPILSYLNNI
jgi:targeting protein for Xklp2